MKVKKSLEQAICIMLVLATSDGPVKSLELSTRLGVSDSYLKKITRQLVVSGLIASRSSKIGGFTLDKPTDEITFLDVFNAIEGEDKFVETSGLVDKVFDVNCQIEDLENYILSQMNQAEERYRNTLAQFKLSDIIEAAHEEPEKVKEAIDKAENKTTESKKNDNKGNK